LGDVVPLLARGVLMDGRRHGVGPRGAHGRQEARRWVRWRIRWFVGCLWMAGGAVLGDVTPSLACGVLMDGERGSFG